MKTLVPTGRRDAMVEIAERAMPVPSPARHLRCMRSREPREIFLLEDPAQQGPARTSPGWWCRQRPTGPANSGAEVTAVTSSAQRGERLTSLGAASVIHDIADAVGPFDLALESTGGKNLSLALDRLTHRGTLIWFGQASRDPATLSFFDIRDGPGSVTIRQFSYYYFDTPYGQDLATLVRLVAPALHPRSAAWPLVPHRRHPHRPLSAPHPRQRRAHDPLEGQETALCRHFPLRFLLTMLLTRQPPAIPSPEVMTATI